MNILALETSGLAGSVAALSHDRVLAQLNLRAEAGSAQTLAPGIKAVLEAAGWRPADVRLVAVAVGPGSFTGLRVGVASAKAFAYAVGAEVLGIDTLEAIACRAPTGVGRLSVGMDAQRGEVVARLFVREASGWFLPDGPSRLLPLAAWLAGLPPKTPVAGPVLNRFGERLPAGVAALEAEYWRPTASAVGRLADRDYAAGRRDDLWTLLPRYSRRSAAEEKQALTPPATP
jgi:tRNA threonylcarbamoyladenosine biosynthesis protein TsaB